MKQILVPTDFSASANNAVKFAVQSAKILPASIVLIHAFEMKGNIYTDYMGVSRDFNQSLLNDLQNKLDYAKRSIEETESVNVRAKVVKGTLSEVVLRASADEAIDFIVMGTVGASGIKEKLWGSRTASVIGTTRVPVMVVPHAYNWKKPEKFLMATNHFEKEPAILDFLFELADLYMAQVQVAVFTDEDDDKAATVLEHTRKAPQYEKMLREQYKEATLTSAHLYGTEFSNTLQKHIEENNIDILVMVTYPKSFWDRIFHLSITQRMSYHTKIPLLVIPAK